MPLDPFSPWGKGLLTTMLQLDTKGVLEHLTLYLHTDHLGIL